ncbi:MAG: chemotaxis-specific protein-glutamate methyltransferase CheB [Methylobacter sp.]|nr:chemotaxis-specific protein-glutamate methyltransferase CheB [Methylobacter sp.]
MTDNVANSANRRLPIRVLVVEDSPSVLEFLIYLFASDQELQVIGTASNGEEALAAVEDKKPDVITMDVHMPKMDGYSATRAIMERFPTPIVIVTGSASLQEMTTTISALEAGALAVIKRPAGIGHPDHAATARELIQTVKLMSEVKVIKRWAQRKTPDRVGIKPVAPEPAPIPRDVRLVAIGASTGGPLALQQLLSKLPKGFQVPIIIVQHIAQGFTEGFAKWLEESSGFPVNMATNGELMQSGHAYVAPNGFQITVDSHERIALQHSDPENGHLPSVSCLFRSVAATYGASAVGILLTGMGKDGGAELGLMKANGAVTFAQDKESSVVHGMPGEAIELGAASYVLPPDKIAAVLSDLVHPPTQREVTYGIQK